jgi:hypothetical protein
MARRYARWRIHRKPPSWLQPRREVAHSLPPPLNLRHWKTRVKSSEVFLWGAASPSECGFSHKVRANVANSAFSILVGVYLACAVRSR